MTAQTSLLREPRRIGTVMALLCGWIVIALEAFAANVIYVDSEQSGVQNGSADSPYATVEQGLAVAAPGDTLFMRRGTYALRARPLVIRNRAILRAESGHVLIGIASTPPESASSFPAYNQVAFKATHNSYWVKRDNVAEAGASGVEERVLDQLLFEGVRALELDIHSDSSYPHGFWVYHTDKKSNALCTPLDECLRQLLAFQHALPQHDVVTVILELKEINVGSPFDDDHTPQDLDATLQRYLGEHLYRPRDLLARCSVGDNIRTCLRQRGWPPLDELRGKFIFAIIGNWNGVAGPAENLCGPHSIDNRGAWVRYATSEGGIASRAAFLVESPWVTASIACQSSVSPADVATAVEASAFLQLEVGNRGALACPAGSFCPTKDNIVVRAAVGGNDKPTAEDQAAVVHAGISLVQNDHPWFAWNDGSPLRPAIPIQPERLADVNQLNEPGHRLLLLQQRIGAKSIVPLVLGGRPSSRWETTVANTRPATYAPLGNPQRPRGTGCIYARTSPALDGTIRYGARICRTTVDGEFALVFVDIIQDYDIQRSTFYSYDNHTDGVGELLRMDLSQTLGGQACVGLYSTERVEGNEPQWNAPIQSACFPETLDGQGLAVESGDVLFVGTKFAFSTGDAVPETVTDYFDPADVVLSNDYSLLNLSWPRVTPAPDCQQDQAGGCAVPVHRSYSAAGGHIYTTNIRAASWWGYDVENPAYFYVETTAGPDRIALYSCYIAAQNRRLYTTDSNCEGNGSPEGIVGYIATSQLTGTAPLYRCYSAGRTDHLYTTDWTEASGSEYKFEAVVGYVWPSWGLVSTAPPIR